MAADRPPLFRRGQAARLKACPSDRGVVLADPQDIAGRYSYRVILRKFVKGVHIGLFPCTHWEEELEPCDLVPDPAMMQALDAWGQRSPGYSDRGTAGAGCPSVPTIPPKQRASRGKKPAASDSKVAEDRQAAALAREVMKKNEELPRYGHTRQREHWDEDASGFQSLADYIRDHQKDRD